MKIEFKKTNGRAKLRASTPSYDYEVLIDGEHRATFAANTIGRGYELYCAVSKRPIHLKEAYYKHIGESVDKQSDFAAVIAEALERNLIPTLEQQKADQLVDGLCCLGDAVEKTAGAHIGRMKHYALDMFEIVKELDDPRATALVAAITAPMTNIYG